MIMLCQYHDKDAFNIIDIKPMSKENIFYI